MGQQEILNHLIKTRKPIDIPNLCLALKIGRTNISRAVRKLKKNNEIIVRPVKCGCYTKFIISLKQ